MLGLDRIKEIISKIISIICSKLTEEEKNSKIIAEINNLRDVNNWDKKLGKKVPSNIIDKLNEIFDKISYGIDFNEELGDLINMVHSS